jgi:alpha-glucosidase
MSPERVDLAYQIFPDRWRNARPDLTPRPGEWTWHGRPIEVSTRRSRLTRSPNNQYTFYGGDLEGIRLSLDYLERLGVTLLYLNPIFAACSTHRYDATDFFRVDSALGDRADFERFAGDLHERKMRLFLDGVFNHTSGQHPWHQDAKSRRRYYLMQDGDRAMSWMGRGTLPKLDTQSPPVVREIIKVLKAWPEVDGWRLDAAHLLPQSLLADLRSRIAPKPIIVEDWGWARHYQRKGLADGVTNFLFRTAMVDYFREDMSPETLLDRLDAWIHAYPAKFLAASWNFLDNHDTPRFRSIVGRERLLRALVLLFTLPGTPLLYHGLEIGLEGKDAGESRAPMIWQPRKWDRGLLEHIMLLARLRREYPVLAHGQFVPLAADNRSRSVAFERRDGRSRALVALNDGYHPWRFRFPTLPIHLNPGQGCIHVWDSGNRLLHSAEFTGPTAGR